ncbi:MAG: polyprenol monophosphomannose synthase [Bdellovibrionia bacterium]
MVKDSPAQIRRPLVFIPTYNEKDNAPKLFSEIQALGLDLDILFIDDNSPDGTGEILQILSKSHSQLHVVNRNGKLGIGSAHLEGIHWAYQHGYQTLITMDCDFTHHPSKIFDILRAAQGGTEDIVVGSRYLQKGSLTGWNLIRRFLTYAGHFATKTFLNIPYDATGGFRLYKLNQIPQDSFHLITSRGYSFFFESLYFLHLSGLKVREIPITLPPRTYGHSKMDFGEIKRSIQLLFTLYIRTILSREKYLKTKPSPSNELEQSYQDDRN